MTENQKLSFHYIVAHIRRSTVFTFNAAQHYYGRRMLSRGYCISAAVTDLSPFNATDRRRIRRVANAMLHACDSAELFNDADTRDAN